MLFGKRQPRIVDSRRRGHDAYHPRGERLEAKILLAIDLGGTSPPNNPIIATAPFGIDAVGITPNQTAGTSVADVGSLLGNNYEDVAIGAPADTTTFPSGSVYVLFGSQEVTGAGTSTLSNWIGTTNGSFTYTANDRVANLGQIQNTTQTNPISSSTVDFPYAGITFFDSSSTVLGLGTSVAGVSIGGGKSALIIGAPGSDSGTGFVFVVTGNFQAAIGAGKPIDLANPPTGLNVIEYFSTATRGTGGELGESVAGGLNILGDGNGDIIMGAPLSGFANTGATGVVYVVSTALLPGTTTTVNVNTLGQSGSNSLVVAGATNADSGFKAGFSVADAGDVNGVTSGTTDIDDLLIGAPGAGASGQAYLIYGGSGLAALSTPTPTPTGTLRFLSLDNIGATGTGAIPGAVFVGAGTTGSSARRATRLPRPAISTATGSATS